MKAEQQHAPDPLFKVVLEIKMIALEIAISIVFFVWLYRELIHQLRKLKLQAFAITKAASLVV
ncbi:hypothetical protein HDF16_005468 [Granulicella aggregans]|uniref:Uncharacterized protein n=1 Tax=Granulicella aggregans TaxID=474949 RepID=A0A7W7ZJ41_9BACT|nr:hypothetical protein [Granulicella aggregans]MBB5060732.1 hypothetical protein [Granulicella aggregans]